MLHNQKRLKIPLEERKKISVRIKEKWLKVFKKITNILKFKRTIAVRRKSSMHLGGYMEAKLAQNTVVQKLQNRFSSQCTALINSFPGEEGKIMQQVPPIELLKENPKFHSTIDDHKAEQ